MKKIIFYIRVTDVLLYLAMFCLILCMPLAMGLMYVSGKGEGTKILLISIGILFFIFLIIAGFSFKYLFKKERLMMERYGTTDTSSAQKKFNEEVLSYG